MDTAEPSGRPRNQGIPLDLSVIRSLTADAPHISMRESALRDIGIPPGGAGADALLRVLRVMDLTSLSGTDTHSRIRSLCRDALSPLPPALMRALDLSPAQSRVAAVCVFPAFVPEALEILAGSGVRVATVAGGFPHGLSDLPTRKLEVAAAAAAGAHEIDVVIRREWALREEWALLYDEVRAFRRAAGESLLKVILSTGDLGDLNRVARTALTALMGGADLVKTSTGKEEVNATLPAGLAICHALRVYRSLSDSGSRVGLKAAGGIRTAREGHQWVRLARDELGPGGASPDRFRIGASGLLQNLVSRLEEGGLEPDHR